MDQQKNEIKQQTRDDLKKMQEEQNEKQNLITEKFEQQSREQKQMQEELKRHSEEPVSYTHLDVYKRQALN